MVQRVILGQMLGRSRFAVSLVAVIVAACAAPASPTPTTPATAPSATQSSPAPTPAPPSIATVPPSSLAPASVPAAEPTPSLQPSQAAAAFDPKLVNVSLTAFASGLSAPVFATGRRDGSGGLLVVEQGGDIRILDSDGSVEDTPFLDIHDRVLSGGEQGLLGLALSPTYESDGRFYVDYTRKPDGATVISEFQADDRFADPTTERILLTIPQPFANHNGGMVAFDAKGMLLIGMGDGGSGGDPNGNGQNPKALLGKLLRIDVNGNPYAIPTDNPFANATATAPEIWDLGLRNPWRFSFDRLTGDLFIGDVGQDAWEEIDAEKATDGGHNYGWNRMEGTHCYKPSTGCDQSGITLPVAEYSHSDGCAVVGGYVYRGSAFPVLNGGYLYSDNCSGTIWGLSAADAITTGKAEPAVLASTGLTISSFGQDDAGELYALDLGHGAVLGVTATRK